MPELAMRSAGALLAAAPARLAQGAGACVLLLAATACLASGLYIAAEWLEDHVKTSYRLIRRATLACAGLQAMWLLCDRGAALPNAVGLLSHAVSWALLRHHPRHQENLPLTIGAVILLLAHQTAWVWTMFDAGASTTQLTCTLAALVWPVPCMLLLSSATDSLPLAAPPGGGGGAGMLGLRSQGSAGSCGSPAVTPTAAAAAAAAGLLKRGPPPAAGGPAHWARPGARDVRGPLPDQQAHGSFTLTGLDGGAAGGGAGFMGLPARLQRGGSGAAPAGKQHRSRVLQGFDALKSLATRHALLPVTDADAEAGAPGGLLSKVASKMG
ncbi:hypothetical protein HT031_004749 [Scenedesmus sp. PABB004]|nr:hypothetical protein HT031_004749 [Scenedesmus sp. PABB004]